ncbi:putative membrane protein [Campylobacter avium LMG 24591]|uniref:Putative membrane protein n=1 Tax=Campylobacter avium LMG 24591 TaxID=522484 RepID=A0A222MY98_9BACT|nr:hypothetical protein [Campylobacter avium]ASQ30771.1 putative membrane protein [Campylobacter avium LMG 24591]OYD78582.1 putative membrane protein [Campylobacter avium]
MIYFLEFLKGASWAFLLFGALYYFNIYENSIFHLCIGAIPGFFMLIISFLLLENYELKESLKSKEK